MRLSDAIVATQAQLAFLKQSSASAALSSTNAQQPGLPQQPTPQNVPLSWAQTFLPPGMPLAPVSQNPGYRARPETEPKIAERIKSIASSESGQSLVVTDQGRLSFTPRSYQYPPAVNTTITPRVSYGLMPFAEIQALAEDTPDVMLCVWILLNEFNSMTPKIVHADDTACDDPAITHLIERPDGFNPLSVWLARWFYNVIVYDAPALDLIRSKGKYIDALRNIDGSTMFALIDERGEQPRPPSPAFLQIIWGTPYGFLSTEQLWYHPRRLRVNAPYGFPAVESANLPARLLNNIWKYETAWFTEGNLPEAAYTAPPGWTNDQVASWLVAKNQALAGNPALRRQFDVWPDGFKNLIIKNVDFRKEVYQIAKREVMEHAGIPVSEIGEAPGKGLGGKGYQDAEQEQWWRKGLAPIVTFTETPFNDVLAINAQKCSHGEIVHRARFAFPGQSIDPEKEQKKITDQFLAGGMTFDDYCEAIGTNPPGGKLGSMRLVPKGAQLVDSNGNVITINPSASAGGGSDTAEPEVAEPEAPAPEDAIAEDVDKGGRDQRSAEFTKAHTGVMVALAVPHDVGEKLLTEVQAVWPKSDGDDPEWLPLEELHITLAFLGDSKQADFVLKELMAVLRVFASQHATLRGKVGGIGKFTGDGESSAVYASFDCPELPEFRQDLIETLEAAGIKVDDAHGFTPHITLAYVSPDLEVMPAQAPELPLAFSEIVVAWAGDWTVLDLKKMGGPGEIDFAKHCGVCEDDDAYYGQPVAREAAIPFPVQGANKGLEIVSIAPEGKEPRPAVFKAAGDEAESLADEIGHPEYVAEEAAWQIDRALDFYLVPLAYVAEVDGERGAVIHYVRGNQNPHEADHYGREWVMRAAALDYLIGQTDRGRDPGKNSNYFTHPDDQTRPILLDNGLSFPNATCPRPIRSVFIDAWRGWGNAAFSAEVMDALSLLKDNPVAWNCVADLVGNGPADLAKARLDKMLAMGCLPTDADDEK